MKKLLTTLSILLLSIVSISAQTTQSSKLLEISFDLPVNNESMRLIKEIDQEYLQALHITKDTEKNKIILIKMAEVGYASECIKMFTKYGITVSDFSEKEYDVKTDYLKILKHSSNSEMIMIPNKNAVHNTSEQ